MLLSAMGVDTPPAITLQPQRQTVVVGGATSFSVTATREDVAYQWCFNGPSIRDNTNANCTVTSDEPNHTANYQVVSNPAGSATSLIFHLMVNTPPVIAQIGDQTVEANTVAGRLSFTFGDIETAGENITQPAEPLNEEEP
jgi:hypothetical protein